MPIIERSRLGDRVAIALLVGGSLAGLALMTQHPLPHAGPQTPEALQAFAQRTRVTHVALIALMWATLIGKAGAAQALGPHRLVVRAGFLLCLLGVGAMTAAALIDGLAVPDLLDRASASAAAAESMKPLLLVCRALNHAAAAAGLAGFMSAIAVWACAVIARRGAARVAGVLALLCSMAVLALAITGVLPMNLHGMLVFSAVELLWNLGLSVILLRGDHATRPIGG